MKKQKPVPMIIVRDKHNTHRSKLDEIISFYKVMNPDNETPDELDKMNSSSIIRKLIDKAHEAINEIKRKAQ